MLKLTRNEHGAVSRYYMGFTYTAYMKAKINQNLDPHCKMCLELGERNKETGQHIILECPRWSGRRRLIFEVDEPDPRKVWPLKLAKYLRKSKIKELEVGV